MSRSKMFSTIVLGSFLAAGAFINAGSASAFPPCPPGVACQDGGKMQNPNGSNGPDARHYNDGQQTDWRRRHHHYSDFNPSVGIYLNSGYGDGYDNGYGWRHHRHCRTIKIWRHHHPVWVKKCFSRHYG